MKEMKSQNMQQASNTKIDGNTTLHLPSLEGPMMVHIVNSFEEPWTPMRGESDEIVRVLGIAYLAATLLVGNLVQIMVLKLVLKQGFFHRPINILILCEEFLTLLSNTANISLVFLVMLLENPMVDYTGPTFCTLSWYGLVLIKTSANAIAAG